MGSNKQTENVGRIAASGLLVIMGSCAFISLFDRWETGARDVPVFAAIGAIGLMCYAVASFWMQGLMHHKQPAGQQKKGKQTMAMNELEKARRAALQACIRLAKAEAYCDVRMDTQELRAAKNDLMSRARELLAQEQSRDLARHIDGQPKAAVWECTDCNDRRCTLLTTGDKCDYPPEVCHTFSKYVTWERMSGL